MDSENEKVTYKIELESCCWDGENYYLIGFDSPEWKIKGKMLPT